MRPCLLRPLLLRRKFAFSNGVPIKRPSPLLLWSSGMNFVEGCSFNQSSGSKDHEFLLIPSIGASKYHLKRAEYVIKLLYSCPHAQSTTIDPYVHGWKCINGSIQIMWDDEAILSAYVNNKGCGCNGGCDSSRAGCKNCFRLC